MNFPTLADLPPPPIGRTGWPWTEEGPQVADLLPGGQPWPRITIVTPSFNQGEFIEETIRSILLQGYPNLEYVIIDGGSKDDSVSVIRKYKPWLAHWVTEKDRGQSHAIRKGFNRASGHILSWLNSDDTYLPQCLVRIATLFQGEPTVGLIHGNCDYHDGVRSLGVHGSSYDYMSCLQNARMTPVQQPSTFFKQEAYARVGGIDVELKQTMDKDLWQRIGAFYPMLHSSEVLSRFRVHPNQLTEKHKQDSTFYGSAESLKACENLFCLGGLDEKIRKLERPILGLMHSRLAAERRRRHQYRWCIRSLALALRFGVYPTNKNWVGNMLVAMIGQHITTLCSSWLRFVSPKRPHQATG